MWPRKQLDIGWTDFAYGLRTIFSRNRPADAEIVADDWIPPQESLVCLSVRTGWDLFLAALRLPPGSEIIVSAVTIPDMIRIIEHHGLVPVPVDVDADRLEPSLDEMEQAISPRTRAILVAHLFGTRIDMEPVIQLARLNGLLVIEDCAQAFVGRDYAGHAETDCSLFSFGPIKTATALGGAVLRIRDAAVRTQMAEQQQTYPAQKRRSYLSRLAKYALFRALARPWAYGLLVRAYRLCGADYDRKLSNAAHSFPGAEFFPQIRRQPSACLARMLQRRLALFDSHDARALRRRTARGNQLGDTLPPGVIVGELNETHTYWVMPLRVANACELLTELRQAGFDATSRSSLVIVRSADRMIDDQPEHAPWLEETIFLPNGHDMPDREWKRMSLIVADAAQMVPQYHQPEPSTPYTITVTS